MVQVGETRLAVVGPVVASASVSQVERICARYEIRGLDFTILGHARAWSKLVVRGRTAGAAGNFFKKLGG